jgi:hypothetical protein
VSALETRVRRLEVATGGGGGGCDRCRGTLIVVSDAITAEFHSARWNGKPLDEHEASEHQTERECPKCGRRIDPNKAAKIRIGGRSGA